MTATAAINGAWAPIGNAIVPPQISRGQVASSTAGRGQFVTVSPTTGYASLNDGTVPDQISAGVAYPAVISGSSTVAGQAINDYWQGFGGGIPASTIASDGFTDADFAVPFFIKDENTPGKLSNSGGSNRSMGGLVFGVDANSNPILWSGPVAWLLARAAHTADHVLLGTHSYLVDAGATSDLTEIQFSNPRAKQHGTITSIEFIANATLAADATNYKTLTVTKYAADGTTPVVVGTMTTILVTTKWVAKSFALSAVAGALDVLEGDMFTIQNSHAASGATTPAGLIRINGKVL